MSRFQAKMNKKFLHRNLLKFRCKGRGAVLHLLKKVKGRGFKNIAHERGEAERVPMFVGLLFFLLILICAGCKAPLLSSPPYRSPEDRVREFYDRYFKCLEDRYITTLESCSEVHLKRKYLTSENRKKIKKVLENFSETRYDPLFCAKNIPSGEFAIRDVIIQEERATLTVIFQYPQEVHSVSLSLVLQNGEWMIENIDCAPYFHDIFNLKF